MPRRKTTRTTKSTDDHVCGYRDASDPKTRARLHKLMMALGVPANAAKVRFVLGDEPSVIWLTEPQS
jgi:hypothetical protein